MSSLTTPEKSYLEAVLEMGYGYVLHFNDAKFSEFFRRYSVNISDPKYQTYGTSKARRMRAFWETEPDTLVGPVLSELLDTYEANCVLGNREINQVSLAKCRETVARVLGKPPVADSLTAEGFLNKEFEVPNLQKLPVEFAVSEIIQSRLKEAQSCLAAKAYLSVIFQCGSVLEAVLLGAAQKEPEKFNRSQSSPKREDKTKPFHEWSLSEFINVASEIGLLNPDIQKFSHGLRDFRNYIHPYEQLASGFTPDEYTAKLCFQALKAALADVSGERK